MAADLELASDRVEALRASAARLRGIVEALDAAQLRQQAYPTEWTVADTLSHLGSGAVIMERGIADIVSGAEPDPAFNQATWDDWNGRDPESQAAGVIAADVALLARIDSLSDDQRAEFEGKIGPMSLDLAAFLGMRLNEHALHTWDVETTFDPDAAVFDVAAAQVIDGLAMIARFTAKPIDGDRVVVVRTANPERHLSVTLGPDAVLVEAGSAADEVELELAAEAFIRLVYGRLDPDHTPAGVEGSATLDELRQVFPGF